MPLFLKHKILFIHIPKCGGSTVTEGLRAAGDPPLLFVADGSVMINGHTPQHMTYKELLNAGWSSPPEYKVAALVRHPVERVLSAFRYIHKFRKDLLPFANTPSMFLDHFLCHSAESNLRFDNHNISLLDFLKNDHNEIDLQIYVRPVSELSRWATELELPTEIANIHANNTADVKDIMPFSNKQIRRIEDFYSQDIAWFEDNFPQQLNNFAHGIQR